VIIAVMKIFNIAANILYFSKKHFYK